MRKIFKSSFLLFIGAGFLATSCQPTPEADFTYDKDRVEIGEVITFKNTSLEADSYEWELGDGTKKTEKDITHAYSQTGTFKPKLTAFSPNGKKTAAAEGTVTVVGRNVKYVGTYNGAIASSVDQAVINVSVTADAGNLNRLNVVFTGTEIPNMSATIGTNTNEFEFSIITDQEGVAWGGVGKLVGGNRLEITLIASDGVDVESYVFIGTK
jgi:PKD repeat protein